MKAVNPFCDNKKIHIMPQADHLPRLYPPCIRILQEKIGSKAGVDRFIAGQLILPRPAAFQGQVKITCFCDNGTISFVLSVAPVHIAVLTPCTDLMAAVPG